MDRKIEEIRKRAKELKFPKWKTIKASTRKGKRASIESPSGQTIHFGLFPYQGQGTYIDHGDDKLRKAFHARHKKIKLKDGTLAYLDPEKPSHYALYLLWT